MYQNRHYARKIRSNYYNALATSFALSEHERLNAISKVIEAQAVYTMP